MADQAATVSIVLVAFFRRVFVFGDVSVRGRAGALVMLLVAVVVMVVHRQRGISGSRA